MLHGGVAFVEADGSGRIVHAEGNGGGRGGRRGEGGVGRMVLGKLKLFQTSLRHNFQLYFDTSSLHGVRFIREENRPFREKFLWLFCTTMGAVATIIIIQSLWEKFQTNPTITGLDTDFHNWDVPFPAVALCPQHFLKEEAVQQYVNENHRGDEKMKTFFEKVAMMSLYNIDEMKKYFESNPSIPKGIELSDLLLRFMKDCKDMIGRCKFKGPDIECCEHFKPMLTEIGPCLTFNTQHAWPEGSFTLQEILETDETLSLEFTIVDFNESLPVLEQAIRVYLYRYDEVASVDMQPQCVFTYALEQVFFSEKNTYTTADTRQLTIKQRRCAFADEIKLDVDKKYTYTFCMIQCRMRLSRKLCGCVAPFYPRTAGYRYCNADELKCVTEKAEQILDPSKCTCELGCDNTVYEVERLQDQQRETQTLEVMFVSWPLIRYKREVLFGWVDLLVSFGGIVGLFLGFSLLSGVEIIYYFTLRACCMARKDPDELKRIQDEYDSAPKPPLDLSLTPYWTHPPGSAVRTSGGSDRPGLGRVQPMFTPPEPSYVSQQHSVLRAPRVIGGGYAA